MTSSQRAWTRSTRILDHVRVEALITSVSLDGRQLPAPQGPVLLDRDARMELMGENGTFQVLTAAVPVPIGGSYSVTALEPDIHDDGWV